MASSGTIIHMIRSIESNAKLLHRTNMFAQLKQIDLENRQYPTKKKSKVELVKIRKSEKVSRRKDRTSRVLIGVLVLIPTLVTLGGAGYLLIMALS